MSSTRGDKIVKGGGTFTLCSSVIVICGNEIKNLCKHHLYEYEDQETWNDVLHDVLEEKTSRSTKLTLLLHVFPIN